MGYRTAGPVRRGPYRLRGSGPARRHAVSASYRGTRHMSGQENRLRRLETEAVRTTASDAGPKLHAAMGRANLRTCLALWVFVQERVSAGYPVRADVLATLESQLEKWRAQVFPNGDSQQLREADD